MDPTLPSRRSFLGSLAAAAAPIVSANPRVGQGFSAAFASGNAEARRHANSSAPILVTLWFDTEDYILPEDDDAALRLATMLTSLGVKATFKVVGEKARVLEKRGRRDVIEALSKHDIGYHSNLHSQEPTPAVLLQHAGWEDGIEAFVRREAQGAKDVERIFGLPPLCYGQPGSSWAPQSYPALRKMGIRMYLDEADHVGIGDQPFYYGGLLNVFRMRSNLARMELTGGDSLEKAKANFLETARALRRRPDGGTISIYYHPNEWVHTEFWDAVNFSKGANPPQSAWKKPGLRPRDETERAFADFEQYIRFIQAQPGITFAPASVMLQRYADPPRELTLDEVALLARQCTSEVMPGVFDGKSLSAAEMFGLLTTAARVHVRALDRSAPIAWKHLDGPARSFVPSSGTAPGGGAIPLDAFSRALDGAVDEWQGTARVPAEVWIGATSLSPADFLATTASAIDTAVRSGAFPDIVPLRTGRITAEQYVSPDSPELWGWVIFPAGFHAPTIMEHAKLQAWTLKPAVSPGFREPPHSTVFEVR